MAKKPKKTTVKKAAQATGKSKGSSSKSPPSVAPVAAPATGQPLEARIAFNTKKKATPGIGNKKLRSFLVIRSLGTKFTMPLGNLAITGAPAEWVLEPLKISPDQEALIVKIAPAVFVRGSFGPDLLDLNVTVTNSGTPFGSVSISAYLFDDNPWD